MRRSLQGPNRHAWLGWLLLLATLGAMRGPAAAAPARRALYEPPRTVAPSAQALEVLRTIPEPLEVRARVEPPTETARADTAIAADSLPPAPRDSTGGASAADSSALEEPPAPEPTRALGDTALAAPAPIDSSATTPHDSTASAA
ncbi:MAG: hypothetical protein HOP12_06335 [Candidatus Eisenbacteria bacterium]|uniref:Uncharacterized protein n=1 Tax=Eiseniibacteriota bacterium TaxID=2212470 RepID=A0A849SME2_UNCEI|nr:hypothetical protein [Candidatus Eisenbacteria bacterium]